jgi:hypothetical protein
MRNLLILTPILLLLQACATSDAKLAVDAQSGAIPDAALSRAPATGFVWKALTDTRPDVARVGYKENGMGMKMGEIDTQKPVTQVVMDAIDAGLSANGQTVGLDNVAISGTLNQFWVQTDVHMTNVQIDCDIEVDLNFTDTMSNLVIHHAVYNGNASNRFQTGTDSNYSSVIEKAINGLVGKLVADEGLVTALAAR